MEILNAIKKRRSPRAFSEEKITDEQLDILFQAASWAPSARNEQPWIYLYARKENNELFEKFISCLVDANQIWAKNAQILILSVGRKKYEKNKSPNAYFLHDVGASNSYLALQAAEFGFQVHQMAGFDTEKTIEVFNLDKEEFIPNTFIAVGYAGNPDVLPENLRVAETSKRTRKNTTEFVKNKI